MVIKVSRIIDPDLELPSDLEIPKDPRLNLPDKYIWIVSTPRIKEKENEYRYI